MKKEKKLKILLKALTFSKKMKKEDPKSK